MTHSNLISIFTLFNKTIFKNSNNNQGDDVVKRLKNYFACDLLLVVI